MEGLKDRVGNEGVGSLWVASRTWNGNSRGLKEHVRLKTTTWTYADTYCDKALFGQYISVTETEIHQRAAVVTSPHPHMIRKDVPLRHRIL